MKTKLNGTKMKQCPSCGGEFVQDPLRPRFSVCGTCGYVHLLEAPELFPGTEMGKYRIQKSLTSGGMGSLFLCTSADDPGTLLVLKVMKHSRDQEYPLENEAELLRGIHQENIVRFFDYWHDGFNDYIVMEYIPGKNLEQLVDGGYQISPEECLRLMQIAANALREVWKDIGLLHRDIKPSNIMLDEGGFVKILDFGIASSGVSGKTSVSMGLGSPGFMSLEQLRRKEDGSCASDIYSLGATIYYVLTKHKPYEGDTAVEIFDRMMHEEPVPVSDYVPDLPDEYSSLLMRMLDRNPENRPSSWDALLDEITSLLGTYCSAE